LERYRSIPPQAKRLIYLSFVPSFAIGFIYTDLSYFLTTVRGFSASFMGAVIMIMGLTTVAVAIPAGILADRYGRKRFLVAGNLLASFALAALALMTSKAGLMAAAMIEGASEAAFVTANQSMLAELAGDRSRTPAYALTGFLSNVAWGLSGFAIPAVILIESFGMGGVKAHILLYLLLAALSLACTPFLYFLPDTKAVHGAKGLPDLLPRKSLGVILRYGLAALLVAFGAGMFVPLMAQWFRYAFGVPDTLSGPVIGISGFLIAAATLSGPHLAGKLGLVKAIVATETLSIVFMLAMPSCPNFALAGAVYIARSFLMNMAHPLSTSLIMGLVDPAERGAASGLTAAMWRFPNSLGAGTGAGWMGAGHLARPFYAASALYAASIAVFWAFFRNARLPEEAPAGKPAPISEVG